MSVPAYAKAVLVVAVLALPAGSVYSQNDVVDPASSPLPNPNPTVTKAWGPLPDGRTWGSTAGVDIDPDGHVDLRPVWRSKLDQRRLRHLERCADPEVRSIDRGGPDELRRGNVHAATRIPCGP